ncbi:unnamed protein product [Rotaria sp. Silwood2]|nr:unnamed protein product [Rotaria sp. Silwood2]
MVLDGFSYIQDRQTDTKTNWRCENHKTFNCHFRIHTRNESVTKTIILEEDSNIHTKIVQTNAGEPVNKKKKYQYLDQRLFNLVSNPHQNNIDQINAIAHNIVL